MATQDTRSQHYCFLLTAWLIAWQEINPKSLSSRNIEYEDFFFLTWLWKKRMFLCLKVCTTGKSYIVLFFNFLMHVFNVKAIILLEMRLHSFKNTFTNNNWPSRNIQHGSKHNTSQTLKDEYIQYCSTRESQF